MIDGPVVFPDLWLSYLIFAIMVVLSIYGWHRRHIPGALPFSIGGMLGAMWVVGAILEYSAVDLETKVFWIKFQAYFQLPVITAITIFLFEYTWPGRWINRRTWIVFLIVPLAFCGIAATNPIHHWAWVDFISDGTFVRPVPGPSYWFFLAYGYLLGALDFLIYIWLLVRTPENRNPVAFMLIGHLGARLFYILDALNIFRTSLPIDTYIIGYLYLMFAIALFVFRIFNPNALVRKTVITHMHEGMLVLDLKGKIVSINPAAQSIFQISEKQAVNLLIHQLLKFPIDLSEKAFEESQRMEIFLGAPPYQRDYSLSVSAIKNFRAEMVGYMCLFQDITEQKQAQAQIIEQQRVMATLSERERMARELHDSIGQVLGYASFQLDAVVKQLKNGETITAIQQLDRLGGVVRDSHADLREHILNLRSAPSLQEPFFSMVRQYLESYQNNYNIQTRLQTDPALEHPEASPDVQLQVFRILQEAISNARRHGHARLVEIQFGLDNDQVRLQIQDDGVGFIPEQKFNENNPHYGLQFMQERALQIHGQLNIQSAPGTGTKITIRIPLKEWSYACASGR